MISCNAICLSTPRLHVLSICSQSSSSDGLRDLAKSIRNRLKPKQNAGKPPKLAYLPVQPASEVGVADGVTVTHSRVFLSVRVSDRKMCVVLLTSI